MFIGSTRLLILVGGVMQLEYIAGHTIIGDRIYSIYKIGGRRQYLGYLRCIASTWLFCVPGGIAQSVVDDIAEEVVQALENLEHGIPPCYSD